MNTRPQPAPLTHTWISESTARALGLDPDTLPLTVSGNLCGDGWGNRTVQIPRSALDAHFGRTNS